MSDRIPTGVLGLDKLIEGGFPRHSMILLAGGPGVGKTILAAKFIYDGATEHGEPGVYACFAETSKTLMRGLQKFGWNFEALILENRISILNLSIGSGIEVQSALNKILDAVTSLRARRLVIDSITAMSTGLRSGVEKRRLTHLLYMLIQKSGCTTIIVTDVPYGTQKIGNSVEEFIADGIILMENHYDGEGNMRRTLRILKMRGTNHARGTYTYVIGENGIVVQG